MAIEQISILDAIKAGDIQASLFTTFNANLKFYEDLILRRLMAGGCRNNVVVMDQQQCAIACASAATRPSLAGVAYTLAPISVSGAFHPKICLLAGKRRASLFVGSHNLTISGFGYNREVTAFNSLAGSPGSEARNALSHGWATVRQWLATSGLPDALLESAYKLDKAFGVQFDAAQDPEVRLLTQHPGSIGLLDQLAALAPEQVRRICVVGAFFDAEGRFVGDLLRRWPAAQVVLGVEPGTVWLSRLPESERLKVVDAGKLSAERRGYLHAKALYLEGTSGRALFASGSANPSAPAWTTGGATVNTEAMLVRMDDAARQCAAALGMDDLQSKRPLSSKVLADVITRSHALIDIPKDDASRVLIGIASHAAQIISLDVSSLPVFDHVEARDDSDHPLTDVGLDWSTPGVLRVAEKLAQIRSLIIRNGDLLAARVLVHHPEVIDRQIRHAAQEPTVDLLRALGSEIEDISRVLPALERLIFSDGVAQVLRIPAQRGDVRDNADPPPAPRPETLRVPLAETHRKAAPSLFAASHDLAYLIEILTRHIDVGAETRARGVDRAGRSEEEQIGQDDEDELTPPPQSPQASDAEIGEAVCRRVGKLCRRMAKAIEIAPRSPLGTAGIIVQLVAVLALLQELSKLELRDRWRQIALFWDEDLESLVDAALERIFVSDDGVHSLCASETPEEVIHLVSVMLWATWQLGFEWWSPPGRDLDAEEQEERAGRNASMVRLLALAAEHAVWSEVRSHIERTLPPDPLPLRNALRWLERHTSVSQALMALSQSSSPAQTQIGAGDVVDVPAVIDRLLVAISTDGRTVKVGSGGEGRSFLLKCVRFLARV